MQRADLNYPAWPLAFDPYCDEEGILDKLDNRLKGAKRAILAFLTAALVMAGAASILVEGGLALEGDGLTFHERSNALVASDVLSNLFTESDPSRFEWTVADDAQIAFPSGKLSGPEGAQTLARMIGGDNVVHVEVSSVKQDVVVLDWRLAGPIAPGLLVFESVPEGAGISGTAEVLVERGEILRLTIEPTS